jgi:hypothetical protein
LGPFPENCWHAIAFVVAFGRVGQNGLAVKARPIHVVGKHIRNFHGVRHRGHNGRVQFGQLIHVPDDLRQLGRHLIEFVRAESQAAQ